MAYEWLLAVVLTQVVPQVRDFGKLFVAAFHSAVEEGSVLAGDRIEHFDDLVPLRRHALEIVSILGELVFVVYFDFDQ